MLVDFHRSLEGKVFEIGLSPIEKHGIEFWH